MTRLIKRYANRKLYDSQASRYVTLDAIADMVRAGEDLRIIDNESGEDLTAVTFAQVIYEDAKRSDGGEHVPVLRWIIRQGSMTLHEILEQLERGREALESVRDAAGEGLHQVQQRFDAQMRASIERITSLPGFRQELHRIEESLRHLEGQLGQLRLLAQPRAEEPSASATAARTREQRTAGPRRRSRKAAKVAPRKGKPLARG